LKQTAVAQESDVSAAEAPLWKRRWFQNAAIGLVGALGIYALVYWDVVSRAHEAHDRAETYMRWYRDPAAKTTHFQQKFDGDRARLQSELDRKKISEKEFRRRLDALEFDRDFALSESSLKYAYQWYKDTYELFSPPESRWVKDARRKAPEVLEMWKQELRSQKVPFDDTMFE
jgi:hypothetical protein